MTIDFKSNVCAIESKHTMTKQADVQRLRSLNWLETKDENEESLLMIHLYGLSIDSFMLI